MLEKRPLENSTEQPANKKVKFFAIDAGIIKIIVGEQKVQFSVHEDVISRCPFFDKCLNAGMKEQHEKEITLPEDHPEGITILVAWLYNEKISPNLDRYHAILAYVAADKYCLPQLQNAIMDVVRAQYSIDPTTGAGTVICARPGWMGLVWKHTSEGSKLRELALTYLHYCMGIGTKWYTDETGTDPSYLEELKILLGNGEISLALMLRFATQGKMTLTTQNPCKQKGCFYHVHEDGEKCGGSD